jgi:hypothetical protein
MASSEWKLNVAKGIRWAVLLFVLIVIVGVGSQRHLLTGISFFELCIALMAVFFPVTPIFITMGFLLKEEKTDVQVSL